MWYYIFFLTAVLMNCITAVLIARQNRKASQARYDAIMKSTARKDGTE